MVSKGVLDDIFGKIEICLHCGTEFRIKANSTLDKIKKENKGKPLCFKCFSFHSE